MDKELMILEQIYNNPHVNQRDLATVTKASLGMTNAILKRFAEKGLITVKKINNRNIRYALTSEGMAEINRRSWDYFKRTIKNVVDYKDFIRKIVISAKADGYKGIVLAGKSDFEFMVEHICYKEQFPIKMSKINEEREPGWYYLIAEKRNKGASHESTHLDEENEFSLNRIIELNT
ncbi:MAG: winged helix-turn-helix transcriptional regulator [Spirochaetales bacterium]|nr:winged helix-turn-helix transcriptional regulator [Spirochaetales bacterium]